MMAAMTKHATDAAKKKGRDSRSRLMLRDLRARKAALVASSSSVTEAVDSPSDGGGRNDAGSSPPVDDGGRSPAADAAAGDGGGESARKDGARRRRWNEVSSDHDSDDSSEEKQRGKTHRTSDVDSRLRKELETYVQDTVKSLLAELRAGRLSDAEFWACLVTAMERTLRQGTYCRAGDAGTPLGMALRLGRLTSSLPSTSRLVDNHATDMVDGDSVAACIMPVLAEDVRRRMLVTSPYRFLELFAAVGPIIYKDIVMTESQRMLEALEDLEWLVGVRTKILPHQSGTGTTHAFALANLSDEARELALTMLTTAVIDQIPEVFEARKRDHYLGTEWQTKSRADEMHLAREILHAASIAAADRQAAALAAAVLAPDATKQKGGGEQAKGGKPAASRFDGKCHYCQKQGHRRADCKKRLAEEGANDKEATAWKRRAATAGALGERGMSMAILSIQAPSGTPAHTLAAALLSTEPRGGPGVAMLVSTKLLAGGPDDAPVSVPAALVDPGSQVSLMRRELAAELKLRVTPSEGAVRVANNQALQYKGDVYVWLKIGGVYALPCALHLVDDAPVGIVLGTDQLFGRADQQNLKLEADADGNPLVGFGKGPLLRPVGMHAAAGRSSPGRLSAATTHCESAGGGDSGGVQDARVAASDAQDMGCDAGAAAPRAAVTTPLPGHTDKAEEGGAEAVAARAAAELRIAAASDVGLVVPNVMRSGYQARATAAPPYRPPGPIDENAFENVVKAVDGDFRQKYPREAATIVAAIRANKHLFGGLGGDDDLPPVSEVEPLSLALSNNVDLAQVKQAPAVTLGAAEQQFIDKKAGVMLEAERLRFGTTAFMLAHAFAVHQNNKLRMVEAHQRMNNITLGTHFPLPVPHEVHAIAATYKFFGSLDLWASYYQIALDDNAVPLTATRFGRDVLEFTVTPMGCKQAPSHAQRVFSKLFDKQTATWRVLTYIDDVLIFATTAAGFAQALLHVLAAANSKKVTFSGKPGKACIGAARMVVLGALVSHNSIEPEREKCEAILNYAQPTTYSELRSFLGMINQIAAHLDHDDRISQLHAVSGRDGAVQWTKELVDAFEGVRASAGDPRRLVPFNAARQLFVLLDGSGVGGGATLCHLSTQTGRFDLIDAMSHKWTGAELNYNAVEREAAVVRLAARRWRHEMLGRTVVVLCDNSAVVAVLQSGDTSANMRLRTTYAELIGYDLRVVHVAGKKNLAADALSRDPRFTAPAAESRPLLDCLTEPLRAELVTPPAALSAEAEQSLALAALTFEPTARAVMFLERPAEFAKEFARAQRADARLQPLFTVAHNGDAPVPQDRSRASQRHREAARLRPSVAAGDDGALFVQIDGRRRLVVPRSMRALVIEELHGPAHLAADSAVRLAQSMFWWDTLAHDVRTAIAACPICQRVAAKGKQPFANLGDIERDYPPRRYRSWEVDTYFLGAELGGFVAQSQVECMSDRHQSIVLVDRSALEALRALCDGIVRPFGPPAVTFSDNGTEFAGVFDVGLRRMGCEHVTGLPERHGLTARVERMHKDLNRRLAAMLIKNGNKPPASRAEAQRWLDIANSAHNSLPNEAGFSPHELLTGHKLRWPLTALVPDEAVGLFELHVPDLAQDVRLHRAALAYLDEERQIARAKARERSVLEFGRTRRASRTFAPGDLVMARAPAAERTGSSLDKVLQRLEFSGVWRVIEHDRKTERVKLCLLVPAPTYDAAQAIEVDYRIEVHSTDVRYFGEGAHDQYDEELSPLNLLHDLRWNAWNRATLSAGEVSTVSARIKAAVGFLLTEEQRLRASAALDKAIAAWMARDNEAAASAAERVLRQTSHQAQLVGPPPLISISRMEGEVVVGQVAPTPRNKGKTEVSRKYSELSSADAALLRKWLASKRMQAAAELAEMAEAVLVRERIVDADVAAARARTT
jgi:hypothetical protein